MRRILSMAVVAGLLLVGFTGYVNAAPKGGKKMVLLETSLGEIKIELNAEKAPVSVKNFLAYVKEGHYNGTIFHRVIKDFMIQGGGFTESMSEKKTAHPSIKNEAGNGLKNERGTVAMARTNVVDSASAQFFINTVNNDFLNHTDETSRGFGYAVFGKVISGMEVVDKIRAVPTGRDDVPTKPVHIIKATILDK